MELSRRKFLTGLAAVTGTGALAPAEAVLARPARTIVKTATATRTGEYLYLSFYVPRDANRVAVGLTKSNPETKVGVGLFDWRGAEYQSPGFRGVYGEESSEFYVARGSASRSFTPGPIRRGKWTVIVPVFRAPGPTEIRVEITLTFGPERGGAHSPNEVGVVKDTPGWYTGDLHCPTTQSSDAFASGTALTPEGWADVARSIGLDFVSLTDHQVVKQNRYLAEAAGTGVLLLGGEEMTNWFHGHATVTGLRPGNWLDWRQRPEGVPLGRYEKRIGAFIEETERLGVYASAAHPSGANLSWQFFADAETDPSLLPDGLEVWTGPFQPDDEATIEQWDRLLNQGRRIFANGGSDTHGTQNSGGFGPGMPTTVVYADSLSREGVVAALKAGRAFVTRRTPLEGGAEVYLSATEPDGQRQIVGGTIYGQSTDTAEFSALVCNGSGMRLVLLLDGTQVLTQPITSDEQTVTLTQPVATGGYVRAELRGEPFTDAENPAASRLDMEAITNPIFLVNGPEPAGNEPQEAPPNL